MELKESINTNVVAIGHDHPVLPENENIDGIVVTQEDNSSVILVECHLCRICGEESKELIYVFDEQGMLLDLAQKIRWHLPITILEDDALPTSVCYLCVSRLDSCHEFANLSLDTEEKLTKFFNTASENEEVWKEIDPSLITRNKNISHEQARRPAFPADKLMEAMSLLRQEKEKERERIIVRPLSEMPNETKNTYETVTYQVKTQGFVEEVVHVYDVIAESGVVEPEPSDQWPTDYSVKIHSEFEPLENIRTVTIDTSASKTESQGIRDGCTSNNINKHYISHMNVCDNAPSSSLKLQHSIQTNSSVPLVDATCNPGKGVDPLKLNPVENKRAEQEYRFICEHCGKGFLVRRTMNDHMIAHHSTNPPHKCDKCCRTFTTYAGWDLHKATHSSEEPYLCDICGKKFKHTSLLQSHKRSHLPTDRKHCKRCTLCGKGFRSQFHLGEHLNVHADRRPYGCSDCDKAFHRRVQLRQHAATHLPDKPFKCPVCSLGFNRRANMMVHLKRHSANSTVSCGICGGQFQQAKELRTHRKMHTTEELEKEMAESNGGKVFRCEVCAKAFPNRKGLIGHLPTHNDKVYSCDFCGKNLSNRTTLAYHVRSLHTGERPFTCSHCDKTFVRPESLTVHERIHTGVKPFACSVCGSSFRCSSSLAQHLRVHNEKPAIQCSVCSKRFLRNGALNVHMRKHTGERPFVCEHCGKAFSQKNDMLKHTRRHTTDKPHSCAVCGTAFALKRDLTRHQLDEGCTEASVKEHGAATHAQVPDEFVQRLELEPNTTGF